MSEFEISLAQPFEVHVVHVPTETLYDLEAFQGLQASLLELAGCRGCTSGRFFLYQAYGEETERGASPVAKEWYVAPGGEVTAVLTEADSAQG
jgi:hypothetical protein